MTTTTELTLDLISLLILGGTVLVIGLLLGLVLGYWLAPGKRSPERKLSPNWSERLRLYRDLKAHRLIVEMDGKAFGRAAELPAGAASRLEQLLQELQEWQGTSPAQVAPPPVEKPSPGQAAAAPIAPPPYAASSPPASPAGRVAPTVAAPQPPPADLPSAAAPTVAVSAPTPAEPAAPSPADLPPAAAPTVAVSAPRPAPQTGPAAPSPAEPAIPPPAGAPGSAETIPLPSAATIPLPPTPAVSAPRVPPAGEPLAGEAPAEKVKPPGVLDILTRAIGGDPSKAVAPKSLAAQVDEILQERLLTSPLRERGIRLIELPNRGLVVLVGLEQYNGVDQVPYPEVQALIRECVQEWERRLEK